MKILARLVLLAVLAAVGFWLWTFLFPSPQKVIRARLNRAASLASFGPRDGNISRVAAIEALGNYFTEEIEIKVDVPNYESQSYHRREELTQAAMAARGAVSSLKVDFPDINVDVDASQLAATADVTLRADINGEKNAVIQEARVYFKKVDGKWLIYRLDTLRTLH